MHARVGATQGTKAANWEGGAQSIPEFRRSTRLSRMDVGGEGSLSPPEPLPGAPWGVQERATEKGVVYAAHLCVGPVPLEGRRVCVCLSLSVSVCHHVAVSVS